MGVILELQQELGEDPYMAQVMDRTGVSERTLGEHFALMERKGVVERYRDGIYSCVRLTSWPRCPLCDKPV